MNRRRFLTVAALLVAVVASAGTAVAGHGRGRGPKKVVVNGAVKSVEAAPGTGFVVQRKHRGVLVDVSVTTDAATVFLKAAADGTTTPATFADVVVGARVQVKGAKPAAGQPLLAKRVLVKLADDSA